MVKKAHLLFPKKRPSGRSYQSKPAGCRRVVWPSHSTEIHKTSYQGCKTFFKDVGGQRGWDVLRDLLTKVSVSAFPEHTLSFRPKPSPRGAASWDTGEALGE